jgi:hypothetical protein
MQNTEHLKNLIGKTATHALQAFPRNNFRIIKRNQYITTDYRSTRINLFLDDNQKIIKATFG